MKEFFQISENPRGHPSNFFVRSSENPASELRSLGATRVMVVEIPRSGAGYAAVVLGGVRSLRSLQKRLADGGWERRGWLSFVER